MAREHFMAGANSVAQGFEMGAAQSQRRRENARADRRMAIDEAENTRAQGRYDREMQEDELDKAVREKKRQKLAADIDLDMEMRRDEMKRMTEAEESFGKFTAGADLIDWGTAEAPTQYEALTRQYLPGILKHESVAKKWEALDGVAKKSQAFTANKIMEQALAGLMTRASALRPELLLNPPKTPDGSVDVITFRSLLEEEEAKRDKEKASFDLEKKRRGLELENEFAAKKAEQGYQLQGQYDPKEQKLLPSQKSELDRINAGITAIDAKILELQSKSLTTDPGTISALFGGKGNSKEADKMLELLNQRAKLVKQTRKFDAPGSSEAPEETQIEVAPGQTQRGNPRQFRQGRFKISVEE